MNKYSVLPRTFIFVGFIFALAACGGGGGGGGDDEDIEVGGGGGGGGGFVANAGTDQIVDKRTLTTLNGSVSSPVGSVSYSWSQLSGVTVTLSNSLVAQPTFTAPGIGGDLTFEVSAYDGVDVVTDTVVVTVVNRSPVANAGSAVTKNGGEVHVLDGTGSSDPDNDQLVYTWTQTAGTAVNFSDIHSSMPSFVLPSADETLSFSLTVSDGEATSAASLVSVTSLSYSGTRLSWEQNPNIEKFSLPSIAETVVIGDYAYTTNGFDGFKIFDVSDVNNISEVGSYSEVDWECDQIAISGNIAVMAGGFYPSDIRIFDITDPTSPSLLSSMTTTVATDMHILGNMLYISTDFPKDLDFIDITDPANPARVTIDAGFSMTYTAENIFVQGTTAYVTTISGPMHVLDVSTPTLPVVLGSTENLVQASSVVVSGNYAYVTDAVFGLRIYDVSVPATPTKVGEVELEGASWSVELVGTTAYVSTNSTGLYVVDITDVTAPVAIGRYNTPGFAHNANVIANTAYVRDRTVGLQIIDVSSPSFITPIRTVGSTVKGEAVEVEAGKAYLADSDTNNGGLKIYNVSDPLAPMLEDTYVQAYGNPSDVTLVGSQAYLTRSGFGFQSVDVSAPYSFGVLGEKDAVGFTYTEGVAVEGDYAYVVTRSNGRLQIYDVSDPLTPTLSSSLDLDSFVDAYSIEVKDNRAYITTNEGLTIVDVTDPTSPATLGSDSDSDLSYSVDVKVLGDLAFVAKSQGGSGGVFILDVSDPTMPAVESNYAGDAALAQSYSGVDLLGNVVYASAYSNSSPVLFPEVNIIDAADSTDAKLTGKFYVSDRAKDIAVSDGYFYVATDTDGMGVMQAEPGLSPRYTQESVSTVLNYTVSWSEFPGIDTIELVCQVSGGSCIVNSVDQMAKTASVSWTLPGAAGDYETLIAVGDQHSFYSVRDRVRAQ